MGRGASGHGGEPEQVQKGFISLNTMTKKKVCHCGESGRLQNS